MKSCAQHPRNFPGEPRFRDESEFGKYSLSIDKLQPNCNRCNKIHCDERPKINGVLLSDKRDSSLKEIAVELLKTEPVDVQNGVMALIRKRHGQYPSSKMPKMFPDFDARVKAQSGVAGEGLAMATHPYNKQNHDLHNTKNNKTRLFKEHLALLAKEFPGLAFVYGMLASVAIEIIQAVGKEPSQWLLDRANSGAPVAVKKSRITVADLSSDATTKYKESKDNSEIRSAARSNLESRANSIDDFSGILLVNGIGSHLVSVAQCLKEDNIEAAISEFNQLYVTPNMDKLIDRNLMGFAADRLTLVFSPSLSDQEIALFGLYHGFQIHAPLPLECAQYISRHREMVLAR